MLRTGDAALRAQLTELAEAVAELVSQLRRPERLALTVDETAEALGISRDSVDHLIHTGRLRAVGVGPRGGRIIVPVEELRAFLQREARAREEVG